MKSIDIPRIRKHFPAVDRLAASKDRAARRPVLQPWKAYIEPGRVGLIGTAPHQDHVGLRAFQMDVLSCVLARDPFALAGGQRNLAVNGERQLQRDSGAPEPLTGQPAGH